MQGEELRWPKVDVATGARESEEAAKASQHEQGTSLENTSQEEAAGRPAHTAHPVRPEREDVLGLEMTQVKPIFIPAYCTLCICTGSPLP